MTTRLAEHLTTWKAWYAIIAMIVFPLSSMLLVLGGLAGGMSTQAQQTLTALLVPLQFILFSVLSLGGIALLARKWPTVQDLGLKGGLTRRDWVVVLIVFAVSHLFFFVLGRVVQQDGSEAAVYFNEMQLAGPLVPAVAALVASVILAPICEELLYRGMIMRPIHDALARRGSTVLAAVVSIGVSAVAFALPHLGGSLTGWEALAYVVTGIGFGLVYLLTGSMTAAMVAHSLQSCVAFGQILLFGRGDVEVSPILWILVFGCPLWVYLIARVLATVFPRDRVPENVAG